MDKSTAQVMTVYKNRAVQRKEYSVKVLGNNAPVPHDMWKRLIPIAMEYDRNNGKIAMLYTYFLSYVQGDNGNDRYMSAWTSLDRIALETGLGRNSIPKLTEVLKACGLLEWTYDYKSNKRDKIYYPMYYSDYTNEKIKSNLDALYKK